MILKLRLSGSRHSLSVLMYQIKTGQIEGVKFMRSEWVAPEFNEEPVKDEEPKHASCPSWMLPGNEDPDYLKRKAEEKKNERKLDDTVSQEIRST